MKTNSPLSTFSEAEKKLTRSIDNLHKAGKLLNIDDEKVQDIIDPQDVHIYRLPINVMGKPISVWGCTSFHNKARGIYKGGIRISSDVNLAETIELSRLMTLKTALSDLEFGGAKTGINFNMESAYKLFNKSEYDPVFERYIRKTIIKEFAHHYRGMLTAKRYVPAPDMGTGPEEMVVIYNETHEPSSVTGKPEGISGWLPGRAEATGYGVSSIILRLVKKIGKSHKETTVAIEGFGNVGSHTAVFLEKAGIKIVGVADKYGGVLDKDGLNIEELKKHVLKHGTVKGFGAELKNPFELDVDILIPAAINDSITPGTAKNIKAKYVVEGANFPTTLEAMKILNSKGVMVIPDIIANSGGVIASSEEYMRPASTSKITKEKIFKIIDEKIWPNLKKAFALAEKDKISLDLACTTIALERVYNTMRVQGWA